MRFFLPTAAVLILALAGCSTPLEKAAKAQQKADREITKQNSRTTEQRRMTAVENGEVNSQRGASILVPDYGRGYDANANTASNIRNYGTKGASSKNYNSGQDFRVDTYSTRDYHDAKPNVASERKYGTKDAYTRDPFGTKTADTKTAPTKESWFAHKEAPARALSDGRRQYLGPESKKLGATTDAKELANWHKANESVVYSDGAVERISNLKTLSVEDIRDLLNKGN